MYYTYVLLSKVDGQFYTGCTDNLKRRFEEHNRGRVQSTKRRKPLDLIYYEACPVRYGSLSLCAQELVMEYRCEQLR
ncbi:GIY-YIG nuclease family protein [candidate division WOR-3 bacterium]|nr:GIY-YIG nuclease family protein [candidate division WOR-3 bacterium]